MLRFKCYLDEDRFEFGRLKHKNFYICNCRIANFKRFVFVELEELAIKTKKKLQFVFMDTGQNLFRLATMSSYQLYY